MITVKASPVWAYDERIGVQDNTKNLKHLALIEEAHRIHGCLHSYPGRKRDRLKFPPSDFFTGVCPLLSNPTDNTLSHPHQHNLSSGLLCLDSSYLFYLSSSVLLIL